MAAMVGQKFYLNLNICTDEVKNDQHERCEGVMSADDIKTCSTCVYKDPMYGNSCVNCVWTPIHGIQPENNSADYTARNKTYSELISEIESLQKELSRLQGEIREAVDNYIFNPCEHCPGFDCSGCTREEKYNKWLERNK
jgi:hypothetical protein